MGLITTNDICGIDYDPYRVGLGWLASRGPRPDKSGLAPGY